MPAMRKVCPLFLLAVLTSVPLGCTIGSAKTGNVEGTVTIDGTTANSGEVVFTSGKQTIRGAIQSDGTYRAVAVPVGTAQVAVVSAPRSVGAAPEIKDMGKTGGGGGANPIPIPIKYASPETSGLSTTVSSGTNRYPIALSK